MFINYVFRTSLETAFDVQGKRLHGGVAVPMAGIIESHFRFAGESPNQNESVVCFGFQLFDEEINFVRNFLTKLVTIRLGFQPPPLLNCVITDRLVNMNSRSIT